MFLLLLIACIICGACCKKGFHIVGEKHGADTEKIRRKDKKKKKEEENRRREKG